MLSPTEKALSAFASDLENARTRQQAFEALGTLVAESIGVTLFTVMTLDVDAGLARRAYSNRPEVYPVSGDKRIERNAWFRQIHDRGEAFVANTIEDIEDVFPDADVIASLGCGSVLNIPIRVRGQVVGTLNLLDREAFFSQAAVERCVRLLRLPAMTAFLVP